MPTLERHGNEKPPKTDSKNPEVTLWKRRLRLAEEKLKRKGGTTRGEGEWKVLIDFFEGKQWGIGQGGESSSFHRITANLIKSNIDAIRPQLYFQNPRVKLRIDNPEVAPQDIPETGPDGQPVMDPQTQQPTIKIQKGTPIAKVGNEIVNAAQQTELFEAIDNRLLDQMQFKQKTRRNINDALVLPYGVSKLEWVINTETIPDETDPAKMNETVVSQGPRLMRVKPWLFLWDPELDEFDLNQAKWVAEVKWLSKADIEEDKYLEVSEKDWLSIAQTDYKIEESEKVLDDVSETGGIPEDLKLYKVFEIHDQKNQRLKVWIEGMEGFARDEDNPYKLVEGTIFTLLGFDETIDDSFPLAISKQIKPKQEAYNFLRSYQVNHAARGHRRYQYTEGSIADEEIQKWERGGDNTLIKTKTPEGIRVVDHAPIQQDSYNVADIIKRETTEDVGVSAYGRSSREPGVDTAFEANLIQSGTDVKTEEKRDVVREYVRSVIKKLNTLLQLFADIPTVEEVVGIKGTRWIEWTNADIQGDFIEDVDIYQSLPYSKLEDRKQTMEWFSLIQQDPHYDPFRVRQELNRSMDKDNSLLITPAEMQAQQEAQKKEQIEMMTLEANLKQQGQQAKQQQNLETQQAKTLRPSDGDVRRRPDMVAGIIGPARGRR